MNIMILKKLNNSKFLNTIQFQNIITDFNNLLSIFFGTLKINKILIIDINKIMKEQVNFFLKNKN